MHACRKIVGAVLLTIALLLTGAVTPVAAEVTPITATKTDKCPVCGMFVAKYPDFLTQITFKDSSHALFDGCKDMFKYYFDLKKYNATKDRADIAAIQVTDYYSMTPIDGRTAWYVMGSDVFGPMGRELMPFVNETDAKEFMRDHSGKKLLRFNEITPEVIKGLE